MSAATKARLAAIKRKRDSTDRANSGVVRRSKRQTGSSNRMYDLRQGALPPGLRVSKSGRLYTERRRNRSDVKGKL